MTMEAKTSKIQKWPHKIEVREKMKATDCLSRYLPASCPLWHCCTGFLLAWLQKMANLGNWETSRAVATCKALWLTSKYWPCLKTSERGATCLKVFCLMLTRLELKTWMPGQGMVMKWESLMLTFSTLRAVSLHNFLFEIQVLLYVLSMPKKCVPL